MMTLRCIHLQHSELGERLPLKRSAAGQEKLESEALREAVEKLVQDADVGRSKRLRHTFAEEAGTKGHKAL